MRNGNPHVTEVSGYQLTEMIGSGGMGVVYKAYNGALNRFAAVKILHQADFAERFKNEAYIQSSVNHRNIARLYEYTTIGDKLCILMEYVDGECLDQLLKRKGKLSNDEAESILRQIVSALVYLHKRDIVHRDIKPQNFKVDKDGTVKMLDFGIAKHKYSPKLTQLGFVVGTTEYLAPEQFQQLPELKSDVWALSVMAYELVTGYMPFEATNPVMMQTKIRHAQYTSPKILIPNISEKLLHLIQSGLKANPANRISARDLEELLEKDKNDVHSSPVFFKMPNKLLISGIIAIAVLFIFIFLFNNGNTTKHDTEIIVSVPEASAADKIVSDDSSNLNKIIINTPGINNAQLILPGGGSQQLPYTVKGKEGEKFDFVIRANGYADKEIQVVLTPRRISYEFNLEKK